MLISILKQGALLGILSTLIMDLLSTAARRTGLSAGLQPRFIGRWFAGMSRGKFLHRTILEASEYPKEMLFALGGHYAIGMVLGIAYVWAIESLRIRAHLMLFALGYGIATSAFAWFWMFPSMGMGFLGMKAPSELRLFRSSLLNHAFFGLGLGLLSLAILPA